MPTPIEAHQPGSLVTFRARDWIVQASPDDDLLLLKPLGGGNDEVAGVFLPSMDQSELPQPSEFTTPSGDDLGNLSDARLLHNAARLSFRNGAGPFRALAKLSFRPRSYQMLPLIMALRQEERARLLIADDVGIGKTIEALLIIAEFLERRVVDRFAVICLPHLCEQWQREISEKLGIDAVVIRSNTQGRLDRDIHGDVSVYDHYPYQIISIDYIKADNRREVFIAEAPDLVIVDEAHTCTRPEGAAVGAQQRHKLLHDLAQKDDRHLVLLTATPHSGKPEEFGSLLGLLDSDFEQMDVATAGREARKKLAAHFIQRRRKDVETYLGEDSPFPERDAGEFDYDLTPSYGAFFDDFYEFVQDLVQDENAKDAGKKTHYWTALGLLRGVMSSPAAGATMLRNRRLKLEEKLTDNELAARAHDTADSYESDVAPGDLVGAVDWTESQKTKLRNFEKELDALRGPKTDHKLEAARLQVEDWLGEGLHPVIFCRFIETANYVGQQFTDLFGGKINVQTVTSEDPDELREERIAAMGSSGKRILVCTDCLSEGINLHEVFSAVLHYDLPWNPNRLEQREGRVDRYGQPAKRVKAFLLFSQDNPVDGVVLEVILRKVREIKRDTGINVPFPDDSSGVIDTITRSILLNPNRKARATRKGQQIEFSFEDNDEATSIEAEVTDKFKRSSEFVTASRSVFAQHGIKAHEIEKDLKDNDEAIGTIQDVEDFVIHGLEEFGVQVEEKSVDDHPHSAFLIHRANVPNSILPELPGKDGLDKVPVSFRSPTPAGFYYLGRNHPLVEGLCQLVLARTIGQEQDGASRAAALRSPDVETKTTILLFRVRNVIQSKAQTGHEIVAEEMLLWGYRGDPDEGNFLTHSEAESVLATARPGSELDDARRARLINEAVDTLPNLRQQFDQVAEARSQNLVEAHERFSRLVHEGKYQVVYPVLPMDVIGTYVLLPDA